MEKLDFLIDYLIKENKNIDIKEIPQNICKQKRLYRSLCNIREPMPISKKYTKIENEFLKEENKRKGIVDVESINAFNNYKETEICLWKGDITTLKVDAIVNAANSQGLGCFIPCHKCIDNAIHSASGVKLRLECNKIMQEIGILQTGKTIITNGYNLLAKYVIHTVEPIIYENVTEAIETIKEVFETNEKYFEKIIFNVFSEEDYKIYLSNLGEIYGRI